MAKTSARLTVKINLALSELPEFTADPGGALVEVFADRRVALPPLGEADARRMLDGLALAPVLRGIRGRRAIDAQAVTGAIVAMSAIAVDLGRSVGGRRRQPAALPTRRVRRRRRARRRAGRRRRP